jgi:RNA polymerase sigma factor (sigma-70 family)
MKDQSSYLEENFLKTEKAEKIASMLGEVNKSYADILLLRFYLEMEIGEIAEVLNITENNASVRIHRAMISL